MSWTLNEWWSAFLVDVACPANAEPLKQASLSEKLKDWTSLTTSAVVRTCESLGSETAARGNRLNRLPESASEYLALDAMAFPSRDNNDSQWPMPIGVFELENSRRDDRVGYSLWKVLCTRAPVRVVFAYRKDWEQTRGLIDHLARKVIGSLTPEDRVALNGETAIITGSRGESDTFPHGYFKLWVLDPNIGKFER